MLAAVEKISAVMPNAGLARVLGAYVNFLQGKERAGIERAVMSKTFAANRFAAGGLRRFVELSTAQDAYFNAFRAQATAEQVAFFEARLEGAKAAELQRMRDIAHDRGEVKTGGFGVDAAHWFGVMTKKIDRLKEVEDQLSKDLLQLDAAGDNGVRALLEVAPLASSPR